MCDWYINYQVWMMDEYSWHDMHIHTCKLIRVVMYSVVSLLILGGNVAETFQRSERQLFRSI